MNNDTYNDDTLMPFGQYKGTTLEKVPAWYLLHLYEKNPQLDKRLREYIEDNMDVLEMEVENAKNNG